MIADVFYSKPLMTQAPIWNICGIWIGFESDIKTPDIY